MRLDLIVVTPKRRYNKILGIISITLAIILISVIIIKVSSENKIYDEEVLGVEDLNNVNELQIADNSPYIPNYSEESKNNIQNIYEIGEKNAYITFDDGPSREITPIILDTLKTYDIKATFFVLGSRVDFCPEIVKRAYEEGHFIANHGYSHVYKKLYTNTNTVLDEYNQTEQCIKDAIENQEYNSHLFRFPGGSHGGSYNKIKGEIANILLDNNISYLDWNCLTNDSNGAKTRDAIMENLINTSQNKANLVVLMHDAGDKMLTAETLPEVLDYLKAQGYTFKNFYEYM